MRKLILEAVRLRGLRYASPLHRALRDLILNLLATAAPIASWVTKWADPRALVGAQLLMLCGKAGASVRTIERLFVTEFGVTVET